jgi:gliding motility-associated-like protein
MIKSISTSDTLLKVQFIGNGVSKIYCGVFSGCRLLKDSIEVQAAVVVNNLELGNDTILCTGTTVELKANPGFVDYTWQDGSTAMIYPVTTPGKYYVTVSDACGAKLSDTLIVSAAPPIVFDIGNDTSLCVHNKVKVTAPAGFLHYTWTPNYNIDNTNTNTVTLSPVLDTMYRIAAEKTPGCFGYDSIRITIKHPLPLQIGNDTSFCAGGSATFSLGAGFQQQQWSNGSTNASIIVNNSGTYSVIATATNSCISYDTARVTVYTNPKVSLPPDAALCSGTSAVLDAGNGFALYLWQDGSTASRQTVQNTGTYWVQVTDGNNCKASDTTAITRINPLPATFLPGDTALCSFAKLEIHPRNKFSAYLWSTNAVSSTITVQQPGTYWLEVQDANGCTGRDSLTILPKHCLQGFFVPDAFSPNGDGQNETFKPILMGTVVKYQLLIFNRWGQVVFQTSDCNAGWDGNLGGKPQSTGAFVWICTYQFEDGPVQNEKGKMVLVR